MTMSSIEIQPRTDRSPTALFAAYVELMKVMLGNLFLINAASATALLSLVGKIPESPTSAGVANKVDPLVSNSSARYAVMCLAVGAFSAVLATALAAWQENRNSDLRERGIRIGFGFGVAAFVFMMLSAFGFLLGCAAAILLK
jgi:hypothetical protein